MSILSQIYHVISEGNEVMRKVEHLSDIVRLELELHWLRYVTSSTTGSAMGMTRMQQ